MKRNYGKRFSLWLKSNKNCKVTSILFILITLFSMFTFSSVTADAAGQTVINLKQTGEYSYTSGWGRTVRR